MRLTTHSTDAVAVDRLKPLRSRERCRRRRRIVECVDGRAIRAGNQMAVRVGRDLDRRVPELLLDVEDLAEYARVE
jgi:hypothetical protein